MGVRQHGSAPNQFYGTGHPLALGELDVQHPFACDGDAVFLRRVPVRGFGECLQHAPLEAVVRRFVEVSDRNIGDFLKTARKYDVDFALKRDKSTEPPTYHVFFSAAKTEDFKRAFSEYVGKGQGKTQKRGEFTREQMQQQAQKLRSKPRKQKQREKTRENRR